MALYLIVVQAHFIMNNIFEGMIWFFLPVSLVITNDIFAYICGITFGRTQLIKLSPKKTVEGFVGAWVMTIIFGVGLTNILMRYKYFICPVNVSLFPHTSFPGHYSASMWLNETSGPWSKHLHRTRMYPKPGIHPPNVPYPPPFLGAISTTDPHLCTDAIPHPCLCHLCLPHRSLWRLLRIRTETHVQY